MTHFSLAEGLTALRDAALAWHAERGIEPVRQVSEWRIGSDAAERADSFWRSFARRPGMFMGETSGWMLYCFFTGMDRGGNWLELPEMPRLGRILRRIETRSEKAYGSRFAAFRVYGADELLKWGGLDLNDERQGPTG